MSENKVKFGEVFSEFIGKAGSIMTVVSPFIELLTKFLP